ncbi:MAG: HDOD domain-containing protein [candidate division Zixibacteria bacterium]|nr:HDOD domain-containing protein [candidate division Zixibacteria bacterium]
MQELKYVDKIRNDDSLLSLPQSLSQVLSMVGTDDYSMEDLSNIIMKDPGLTTRILKMANSSFYGHSSEISTLHQAVMMLGAMQVKCLALSASIFQPKLLEARYGIDIKGMFLHFIGVALGCQLLSSVVECESQEELFIAGLLHDIGQIFFIHHFPEDYKKVIENRYKYNSDVDAEMEILGIDHATIGRMLAEKWGFPQSLCNAIGSHHIIPDRIEKADIVNIVQLSEALNSNYASDSAFKLESQLATTNHLIEQLNIDREVIDEISYSLLNETIITAEHLGIDIGDPSEILARANRELFNSFMTIENLFRERQNLSKRIIVEERRSAMVETKNVAIATLSHYINNSAMAISGRAQLLGMLKKKGSLTDKDNKLEPLVLVMENSVKKIMAVLQVLRNLTNLEEMEKYTDSKAINIDEQIKKQLKKMENESGLVIPIDDLSIPTR